MPFQPNGPKGEVRAAIVRELRDAREVAELLPRYAADNIFISEKFKKRFPDFRVTPFEQGLRMIREDA